jgi:EamA domain-containing membrane protein RarD
MELGFYIIGYAAFPMLKKLTGHRRLAAKIFLIAVAIVMFSYRLNHPDTVAGMLAAYGLILLLVTMGSIPKLSIIAVIPMGFSLFALKGAIKYKSHIGLEPKYLAANVVAAILTLLLLGIALVLG